jgi:hypothetical protein
MIRQIVADLDNPLLSKSVRTIDWQLDSTAAATKAFSAIAGSEFGSDFTLPSEIVFTDGWYWTWSIDDRHECLFLGKKGERECTILFIAPH